MAGEQDALLVSALEIDEQDWKRLDREQVGKERHLLHPSNLFLTKFGRENSSHTKFPLDERMEPVDRPVKHERASQGAALNERSFG
jgi:hypothetical protein